MTKTGAKKRLKVGKSGLTATWKAFPRVSRTPPGWGRTGAAQHGEAGAEEEEGGGGGGPRVRQAGQEGALRTAGARGVLGVLWHPRVMCAGCGWFGKYQKKYIKCIHFAQWRAG